MRRFAALAIAIMLAGCGGSIAPGSRTGQAAAEETQVAPNDVAPDAIESECAEQLEELMDALEQIDGRLNVGLNFQEYGERVGDASVAHQRIDVEDLSANCIERAGVPAEDALEAYVDAYNTWNDCIGDVDCDTDTITPDLQAKWAEATDFIADARDALDE